jgi:hypothetical protein
VITINSKFQHAYECDTECFQFVEAHVRSEKMATKIPTTNLVDDVTMAEQG